jgi:hypothetical protein
MSLRNPKHPATRREKSMMGAPGWESWSNSDSNMSEEDETPPANHDAALASIDVHSGRESSSSTGDIIPTTTSTSTTTTNANTTTNNSPPTTTNASPTTNQT